MTIAKRLLLIIATAIAALVLVSGIGISRLLQSNARAEAIATNVVPSIVELDNASIAYLRLRANTLQFLAAHDAKAAAEEQGRMQARRGELEKAMVNYAALLADDEDRRLYAADKAALATLLKALDDTAARFAQGKHDEAGEMARTTVSEKGRELLSALEAHRKYNDQLSQGYIRDARSAGEAATWQMVAASTVAVLLIAIMGITIYRAVIHTLTEMEQTVTHIEATLDFTHRVSIRRNDEVGRTLTAFNRLLERLQDSFRSIMSSASGVRESAGQVSLAAQEISQAAAYQSESTSGMAATVEQMTVSINHVADRARDANSLSSESGQTAEEGGGVISQTVADINAIADAVREASGTIDQLRSQSEQISAVVEVIRGIADQTNLLALNAAIEAARAGEQGRGFAVVADEVRKLAERTALSTQEIATMIETMQSGAEQAVSGMHTAVAKVENGVSGASQASHSIQRIRDSARTVVDTVGDISEALTEQSTAMSSIAQQVERIAQMTDENSSTAHSTADAARVLDQLAERMHQELACYRV